MNGRQWILALCCTVAGFFASNSFHAADYGHKISSSKEEHVSPILLQFAEELDRGDCDKAWKTRWQQARLGDSEALADLAMAGAIRGLVPPSYGPMSETEVSEYFLENYTALILYGWRSYLEDQIPDIGLGMPSDIGRRLRLIKVNKINRCLKSNKSKDMCVDLAVELKLILPFNEFVERIDNAPIRAHCVPIPDRPLNRFEFVPFNSNSGRNK